MPKLKPPSLSNEPPNDASPKSPSHQLSSPSHSTQLIDPYLEVVFEATQDDNQPLHPQSQTPNLTRGLIAQEINHLHDLSNLIEMHLQNLIMAPSPS
ncbi:hypothetical protein Tco_0465063 [Tanacetum coccineum]